MGTPLYRLAGLGLVLGMLSLDPATADLGTGDAERLFVRDAETVVNPREAREEPDPLSIELQALVMGFESMIQKGDLEHALRLFNPEIQELVAAHQAYADFFEPILPPEGCSLKVELVTASGTRPAYNLVLRLHYIGCPNIEDLVWIWKAVRTESNWTIEAFSEPDTPRHVELPEGAV